MAKTDLPFPSDDYAPVADRVRLFYERYPTGRIITTLVSRTERDVVVKAAVFRSVLEKQPSATGWAAEREGDGDINTVACLENTETSAVGRALANLGFTASPNRPSREEMDKANRARARAMSTPRRQSLNLSPVPPPAPPDLELQHRADHATEVMTLLGRAERLGLSERRARVLRERLTRRDAEPRTLHRIGRLLRKWLDHRFDRALAPW